MRMALYKWSYITLFHEIVDLPVVKCWQTNLEALSLYQLHLKCFSFEWAYFFFDVLFENQWRHETA